MYQNDYQQKLLNKLLLLDVHKNAELWVKPLESGGLYVVRKPGNMDYWTFNITQAIAEFQKWA